MILNSLLHSSKLDTSTVLIYNEFIVFRFVFFLYIIIEFFKILFYFLTDITIWKILQIWNILGTECFFICPY